MAVRRIVANIAAYRPDLAKRFYGDLLGLTAVMDHGWIVTFAGEGAATPQVSLSCAHPFARAFYVEGDGLDEPLELSVFDAAFTLPMAPGRHELSISVLTSYGRCAPNALVYTVNPTA